MSPRYVSEAVIQEIAQQLDIFDLDVRSVLSYYSMLRTKPAGKFNVQVCTNISCMLRGGYEILDHCKAKLGGDRAQTDYDAGWAVFAGGSGVHWRRAAGRGDAGELRLPR